MNDNNDIKIIGTSGGKPIYKLPPSSVAPPPLWKRLVGEDMFTGMTVGAFASIGLKLAAVAFGGVVPGLLVGGLFAGGTAIGALINKHYVDKAVEEGETIKPPSRANSGMLSGLLGGFTTGAGLVMLATTLANWAATGLGFATAAAPLIAGAGMLPVALAAGAAMSLYSVVTRSGKKEESLQNRYDSVKHAYEIQEGITDPAQERIRAVKKDAGGLAVASGVAATAATVDIPTPEIDDITSAAKATGTAILADEIPESHPAYAAKQNGVSFAAKEMQRRNNIRSQIHDNNLDSGFSY